MRQTELELIDDDRSNPVFVRIHELPPGSPSFCPHPLRLPHRELGWRAAEMLFDEIYGKALSASTVVLRPELVVRESTRNLCQGGGAEPQPNSSQVTQGKFCRFCRFKRWMSSRARSRPPLKGPGNRTG